MTAESGSSRSVKAAVKSPDEIQVNTRCAIARESGSRLTSRATAAADTANETTIAPQATAPDITLLTRRPKEAFSRKPTNGRSGIRSSMSSQWHAEHAEHAEHADDSNHPEPYVRLLRELRELGVPT